MEQQVDSSLKDQLKQSSVPVGCVPDVKMPTAELLCNVEPRDVPLRWRGDPCPSAEELKGPNRARAVLEYLVGTRPLGVPVCAQPPTTSQVIDGLERKPGLMPLCVGLADPEMVGIWYLFVLGEHPLQVQAGCEVLISRDRPTFMRDAEVPVRAVP